MLEVQDILEKVKSVISSEDYPQLEECMEYNVFPSIIPTKSRIIAIGDIHGDLKLAVDSLFLGGVIKSRNAFSNGVVAYENLIWIGEETVVVQVGDQIDRCRPADYNNCDSPKSMKDNDEASDIAVIELFTNLDKLARKDGGMVISLLGNHEIMNVFGDLGYVSYLGLQQFNDYVDPNNKKLKFKTGKEARVHAFKPGNQYGKLLGCTRLAAVIVGSNLFVHAGILPTFSQRVGIKSAKDISKINATVREWLVGKITRTNIDNIVGSFKDSMFWTRIMGAIPPNTSGDACDRYLKPVLKMLNVGAMIVGHTPQFPNNSGINSTCNGSLWRVDIGGSDAFDGFATTDEEENRAIQVLEISNDTNFRVLKWKTAS